ncbi:MAG TPA: hypothetical protein VN539_04380 [Candidatus Saccharimonadales bacterium]|nr:hypothetical protein [Candidatus Saccharimonadales bacterium]
MTLQRLFLAAILIPTLAATPAPPSPAPEPAPAPAPSTAIGLFAQVERAWSAQDAERLSSLVDTTAVRIAIKPGTPLATASTRVAVTFLLQDQLRLVHTQEFRVTRFDCDRKRGFCRAYALWTGDWGGRQGKRAVRVTLTARPRAGLWLLTEIRAED